MLVRLLKLLIFVAWIPLLFAILVVGIYIIFPILAIVSIVKWIFTGKSLSDWLLDCYFEFLFSDVLAGSIYKIIEYKNK